MRRANFYSCAFLTDYASHGILYTPWGYTEV